MSNSIWSYREDVYLYPAEGDESSTVEVTGADDDAGLNGDFIGYDVQATDGSIGKIDETSLEAGSSYVVVDTGWWIFGKKRMIPAGVVQSIDHDNKAVYVGLTKEDVKSAPDFEDLHREDRSGYDEYYGPYGA